MTRRSGLDFYESLPTFERFDGITATENYQRVPGDWWVLVTDVKNSREAVEDGRYRDVNKIGAASVTTVRNALDGADFPFSFGGDGATVVVSEDVLSPVKKALASLRKLSDEQFNLDLRLGAVSVAELREEGYEVEVARMRLAEQQSIATFRGGGLQRADELIKSRREKYRVEADPRDSFDLEGLSCRWDPIPNRRGTILTILVRARTEDPSTTYRSILETLDDVLDGGLEGSNPVNVPGMAYRSLTDCLRDEVRYHDSPYSWAFVGRVLEILLAVTVFRFGINPGFIDVEGYTQATRTHSDYRKFDDMLRLIVDCDAEERDAIRSYLSDRLDKGTIYYGLHESDESLMTCYVNSLDEGGHLHFIDGADGGYTLAAQQLKEQITKEQ